MSGVCSQKVQKPFMYSGWEAVILENPKINKLQTASENNYKRCSFANPECYYLKQNVPVLVIYSVTEQPFIISRTASFMLTHTCAFIFKGCQANCYPNFYLSASYIYCLLGVCCTGHNHTERLPLLDWLLAKADWTQAILFSETGLKRTLVNRQPLKRGHMDNLTGLQQKSNDWCVHKAWVLTGTNTEKSWIWIKLHNKYMV